MLSMNIFFSRDVVFYEHLFPFIHRVAQFETSQDSDMILPTRYEYEVEDEPFHTVAIEHCGSNSTLQSQQQPTR